ncbi:Glycoside hydrolase [Phytophthora megakarya]|uniref:Glycoside hydrolase n=1 Tax=Phytophthora megakarya TaxID=4795 RepID=A0A225VTW3_9STRA|nr:Glycoside hydrolase [Phytophthora megakarya]
MPLRQILLLFSLCLELCSTTTAFNARCFPPNFLFSSTLQVDEPRDRDVSDVERAGAMGLTSVHLSMPWARLLQWDAENELQPNAEGLAFYHALLDDLQKHNLQAIVTLYQFNQTQNWLNTDVATQFETFAELVFNEFGYKVKYWVTFSEPLTFIRDVYGSREATEEIKPSHPYTLTHNVLRSHAKVVARFRELQEENVVTDSARIGIALNAEYGYPVDETNALDVTAAERKMEFDLGWFLAPLVTGDYPQMMRERVGERLPRFSPKESALVKGSYDVLMLNQYRSRVVTDCGSKSSGITCGELPLGYARDRGIDDTSSLNGAHAHVSTANVECSPLEGYQDDYLATIKWLHAKDPSAEILLTENRMCGNDSLHANVERVYKCIVDEKVPIVGYSAPFLSNNTRPERKNVNTAKRTSSELAHTSQLATDWFARLSTAKCWENEGFETTQKDSKEKDPAEEIREKQANAESGDNEMNSVPWSLNEVILLLVVGIVVLGAITCEAMRELRLSSQGSLEELQVLITIEE